MTLTTNKLTIGYSRTVIQSDLNLTAHPSTMIALLGTNGTGKSTLLRTLSSLQPALSGDILFDNRSTTHISHHDRAKLLSVVLTDRLFSDHTTVHDLIAMGRIPYTSWTDRLTQEDHEIIERSATQVNLTHKLHSPLNSLSDGERQRASIARALAQDTPLILLDEPTSHLDLPNRIEVMLLLKDLAEHHGKTIIISTHEINLALQTAHQIWFLSSDRPILCDTPQNLIANPHFLHAFSSPHFTLLSTGDFKLNNTSL